MSEFKGKGDKHRPHDSHKYRGNKFWDEVEKKRKAEKAKRLENKE